MGLFDFLKKIEIQQEFPNDAKYAKYIYTKEYSKLEDKYYSEMNQIEAQWKVLSKEKDFHGDNARKFERLCKRNIKTYKSITEYCDKYDTPYFDTVPVYKKQKRYNDAANICLEAIRLGAVNEYGDGHTGKMQARFERLAKKANILNSVDNT